MDKEITTQKIIKYLRFNIKSIKDPKSGCPMDEAGWHNQDGLLLTGNQAQFIINEIENAMGTEVESEMVKSVIKQNFDEYEKQISDLTKERDILNARVLECEKIEEQMGDKIKAFREGIEELIADIIHGAKDEVKKYYEGRKESLLSPNNPSKNPTDKETQ